MKLTSEPKPVRIRIKSGGKFHSTLDSLRNAFSIDDLKENENEKQFKQWLKRQGVEGKQIAEDLTTLGVSISECNTIEDYFNIYKIFFKKDGEDFESVDELSLFFDKKFAKNYEILVKKRMNIDVDYLINNLEKIKKELLLQKIEEIKRSGSSEVCFKVGKLLIEKKLDIGNGTDLIRRAIDNDDGDNSVEAKGFFEKYLWFNEEDMKKQIAKTLGGRSSTNKVLSPIATQILIFVKEHRCICGDYLKIGSFELLAKALEINIEAKRLNSIGVVEKGMWITQNEVFNYLRNIKDDIFIDERRFITLICLRNALVDRVIFPEEAWPHDLRLYVERRMLDLAKTYYPMKYLLEESKKHPILDELKFRSCSPSNKIRNILLNLLEFHDFNK